MGERPRPTRRTGSGTTSRRIDLDAAVRAGPRARAKAAPSRHEKAANEVIDPTSPWFIPESRFPHMGTIAERLRFCVRYAVLAPSSHNSQPWRFRIDRDHIDVLADRSRALPVVDPHDRELTISCGAALYNLRLGMRHHFLDDRVDLLPDPAQPDLLARVGASPITRPPSAEDESLYRAIPERRTTRTRYDESRRVPQPLLDALAARAKAEGAMLTFIEGEHQRLIFAKLVAEADEIQFAAAPFRRELALWMHHSRTSSLDGMPGYALGLKELSSLVAPLIVRTFDMGHGVAARDEQLALHSPVLAVLSTPTDDEVHWMRAGQALSAVLLRAAASGLAASYLNQPVEVGALRTRVASLAMIEGHQPQVVLRLGFAPPARHTPRRPAEDVVV